jgi:hypothetical protein
MVKSFFRTGVSFLGAIALWGQSSRPITGSLFGDDGKPLVKGIVRAKLITGTRSSNGKPSGLPSEFTAATDDKGAYRLEGLSLGNYEVCARAPGTDWLESCDFGGKPQVIGVPASSPPGLLARTDIAGPKLVLRGGGVILVRIDDSTGLLAKSAQNHVLVGMEANAFRPGVVVKSDGTGRTYRMLAPKGVPVSIVVGSSDLQLADVKSNGIGRSTKVSVLVPPGDLPVNLQFLVTGPATGLTK